MKGENIRRTRERLDMSQAEFAALTGIPKGTLQGWEIDRRKPNGAAAVLLQLLATHTEIVAALLRELPEG